MLNDMATALFVTMLSMTGVEKFNFREHVLKKNPLLKHRALAATVFSIEIIIILSFGLTGCGSGGETTGGRTDDENNGVSSTTQSVSTAKTTVAKSAVTIKSIEEEVSRMRGLPIRSEIAVSHLSREELRREMKAQIEKEYSPAEVSVEEKVLKGLGLLEEKDNLTAAIEQMLGEEVAGFYDDETKELKLVSDKLELNLMNQVTLAHEVTHALQDQNFSLSEFLPENSGNDDADLARLALVEGDATVSETDYTAANFSAMDLVSLLFGSLGATGGLGTNSYLEDSLLFPYTSGMKFVNVMKEKGGWLAVDSVYGKPPLSTEQVMHPEKYLSGEAPVLVDLSDMGVSIGPGWSLSFENNLGEFGLVELLSVDISSSRARRAAAGWGGDAIEYYEGPEGTSLMVVASVWDSQQEATEFAKAMGEALENRYDSKFELAPGTAPVLRSDDGVWLLAHKGLGVVLVQAPDQALAEKMLGQSLLAMPA